MGDSVKKLHGAAKLIYTNCILFKVAILKAKTPNFQILDLEFAQNYILSFSRYGAMELSKIDLFYGKKMSNSLMP